MRLHCPSCKAAIPGPDLDLVKQVGICRSCGEIVPFPTASGETPLAALGASLLTSSLHKPYKLRWETTRDDESGLEATLYPDRASSLGLLLFAGFWDAFLVFWYCIAFSTNSPWIMKVFPIIHVAVGIGITYSAIAGLVNRTVFRINKEQVSVRTTPLAFRQSAISEPLTNVEAFESRERDRATKTGSVKVYDTVALTGDKRAIPIHMGGSRDESEFLTSTLNRAMLRFRTESHGPFR